ncbi:MAG TPA: beta-propeller fold lactonase family protein [Burkholderiales bacterium]|nr:beta-propeller fold lactonase family protein [Burkholderiales bacterium]
MRLTNGKAIRAVLLFAPLVFTGCGGGSGSEDGNGNNTGTLATPASAPAAGIAHAYAYVADDFASTVSGYSISMTTGQLTPLGTVEARSRPVTVNIHPDGKFAYVTNVFENGVSAYRINPATGALALLGVTEHLGANIAAKIAVDASGRFLYMAINYAHDSVPFPPPQVPQEIATYRIDPDTGELTLTSTLVIGRHITSIIVPPAGNVAYVASPASLSAYAIDAVTGSLSRVAEVQVNMFRVQAHPSGMFAYVETTSEVIAYGLDPASGTLTPVGTPVPSGVVAVHPGGNFVYVASSAAVSIYRVDAASGALVPAGASAPPSDLGPFVFDPSGKFAYIGAGSIQTYSVDPATGALTPVGTPVARSSLALSIATASII